MGNTNSNAELSSWFRAYEKEVNGTKNANGNKKIILLIVPILLIGGMIGMMIKNGALQEGQPRDGIYVLLAIGAFIIVMMLIGIKRAKTSDAAAFTRKDLDALLDSPETAEEFDRQMKAAPLFQVMNQKNDYVFATKDYIGTQFPYLGDKTYRFVRLSDVKMIHSFQSSPTRPGMPGHFDVEFCDANRKVLITWVANSEDKANELREQLTNLKNDVDSVID